MNLPVPVVPGLRSLNRPGMLAELRALAAVARREWFIIVRYPSWVVAMLIWPVLFPAAYVLTARALAGPDGSGLASFLQVAGTADYLGYIAVGTTVWMWQNTVLWDVGNALRGEQLRGTLETNWLSPTWRFSFLIGYSIAQLLTMFIFLVIAVVEFGLVFGVRFNGSPWLALLVLLAGLPSLYGVGIVFASLVISVKETNAFVFLVRGLVMIFCGITFPVTLLPDWMQAIAAWLPPTYLIRGMRSAILMDASLQDLLPDLLALLGFGLFWLTAGFLLFNRMERLARRTGAISQY